MNGYTKGPWIKRREGFSTVYVEARIGGGMLQEVAACGPTEGGQMEQEANARLIAAAPELYEALKDMLAYTSWDDPCMYIPPAIQAAREAIAKAEGK